MSGSDGKQADSHEVPEAGESFTALRAGEDPALRAQIDASELYAKLRKGLQQVEIDGRVYYIAEGDTLLDEMELAAYALEREAREKLWKAREAASSAGLGTERLDGGARGLIAMTQGGKIVRWKPGTQLTYRVARGTFANQAKYDMVVTGMRDACMEWERTCGVDFRHLSELDQRPGVDREGAVFVVREFNAQGRFIASAFFPNATKDRRLVLVDPSFYTTSFDRVGVFRHELGHVLGFRHEHIRSQAPPACPNESLFDIKDLTAYDPQSVMHYFCGGVGSTTLRITDLDRSGAQQVYGPPLSAVVEV